MVPKNYATGFSNFLRCAMKPFIVGRGILVKLPFMRLFCLVCAMLYVCIMIPYPSVARMHDFS